MIGLAVLVTLGGVLGAVLAAVMSSRFLDADRPVTGFVLGMTFLAAVLASSVGVLTLIDSAMIGGRA